MISDQADAAASSAPWISPDETEEHYQALGQLEGPDWRRRTCNGRGESGAGRGSPGPGGSSRRLHDEFHVEVMHAAATARQHRGTAPRATLRRAVGESARRSSRRSCSGPWCRWRSRSLRSTPRVPSRKSCCWNSSTTMSRTCVNPPPVRRGSCDRIGHSVDCRTGCATSRTPRSVGQSKMNWPGIGWGDRHAHVPPQDRKSRTLAV